MSMDCVNQLLHNKRRLEGEHEQWHCQPKRVCPGFASCIQAGCESMMESPVNVWKPPENDHQNITNSNQHVNRMVLTAQSGSAQQCCPRCMAGEPVGRSGSFLCGVCMFFL
ncbi:uncharacterized protein si:ch211-221j21.3 isoform X2 [Trichomycterus rosablanca]